ncbi:MAG: T9SS type A sorting domain-containing protein [Bacteroidales bacterium]|nr:T9SS type A sorting domain-containing protein [Bacteroidales bacterium]
MKKLKFTSVLFLLLFVITNVLAEQVENDDAKIVGKNICWENSLNSKTLSYNEILCGLFTTTITNSEAKSYFINNMYPEVAFELYDWGDAPDDVVTPGYPTLSGNNGAFHTIVSGINLGVAIDDEADGIPESQALGDDNTGIDDEDGVIFTSVIIPGGTATIAVTASTNGNLNAWIDFNGNGNWSDPFEQIFVDRPLVPGLNNLSFNVPSGEFSGISFARFRFSTEFGIWFGGHASDGEVEDYEVIIEPQAEAFGKLIYHKTDPGQLGIYVSEGDGTDETQLTDHGWYGEGSPISEKIAFGEFYNDGIWTVGRFGGQEQLTNFGNSPTWSPTANQIAFFDCQEIGTDRRIYVMDSDDPSTATQISNTPGSFPKWSPLSDEILFYGEGGNGIWIINSDGSGEAQLTTFGTYPTWSPDGSQIAYTGTDGCIWIMDSDATNPTKLTTELGMLADWRPNGEQIAFEHTTTGGIWVIDIDGSNEIQINTDGHAPCWLLMTPGAIISGKQWLALQQNADGSWGNCCANYICSIAKTGLAVLKLETNAIEAGYYPIDPTYVFYQNVRDGLDYIMANAHIINIAPQTHGNPDSDGDGLGVYFVSPAGTCGSSHTRETYETSIVAMAIAASTYPDTIVDVVGSPVYGWTYSEVLDDVVDYMAWAQTDAGVGRGGWNYVQQDCNNPSGDPYQDNRSDQSNSGYASLGLAYAEAPPPYGFGLPLASPIIVPNFVRTELNIWVTNIQNPVDGDPDDGGSHYESNGDMMGTNILRTGNMIQQMAWLGDVVTTPRVQAALDYMEVHWYDIGEPGWRGPGMSPTSGYHAMYTAMKGLEALGIHYVDWPANTIDWYLDFRNTLVAEQNSNGSWPSSWWDDGEQILSTEWALLTLQAVVIPPPELPDLIVTEKYEEWVDEPYYRVHYEVLNGGNIIAPASIVGLEIDGVFIDTMWIPALPPAASHTDYFDTLIIHSFGSDTIIVCADYYDDILELNEANNCNLNTLPSFDFGDAPDDPTMPGYPTLLANNGAVHQILRGYYLGNSIDQEFDGQPTFLADGDDYDGNNDEQGVALPSSISSAIAVTIPVTASGPGYLNAWIDYDINGDWNGPNEQIFTDEPLIAGINMLTFNVPAGINPGFTFARFRFSSITGLTYEGLAPDGEVEDYDLEITEAPVSKMHFPQWPDLNTTGVDVYCMGDVLLADDFRCTETGYITDITIWGSWLNDIVPSKEEMPNIKLTLWSDNPNGPNNYSEPKDLLWERSFIPEEYMMFNYAPVPDGEWFYWPHIQQAVFPGDWTVYELDFTVPEPEAFIQDSSTIYWLGVNVYPQGGTDYVFGWKSSLDHFNDFAVWQTGPPVWNMLCYPMEHPLADTCMDLSFNISGYPNPSEEYDWGDAPDEPYPTLQTSNGAHHKQDGYTFLGQFIDTEFDGQPDIFAMGDDINNIDDEDGVKLTSSLIPGQIANIDFISNGNCLLNGWIDFNNNGSWADPSDHVFINVPLIPGLNPLIFNVPTSALKGDAYARFRVNQNGGIGYDGFGFEGEVEDYKFFINDTIPNIKIGNLQFPDPNGWDINMTTPAKLGDDWICIEDGPINGFHFWVSWLNDIIPDEFENVIEHFEISIYSDIPAEQSPTGYSMPGDILWNRNFVPGEFSYHPAFDNIQGWFNPYSGNHDPMNHQACYRIDIEGVEDPFIQEEGTIYWLVINSSLTSDDFKLGWKTSIEHWNDNAVYCDQVGTIDWYELYDPVTQDILDLAFVLTGTPSGGYPLNVGYQFVSTRLIPYSPDMLSVLSNNLPNIDFIRNTAGLMLRKIGPVWVNNIGDWITTEGYLFKMNYDDELFILGDIIDPQTPIDLVTGYQIISYLPGQPMSTSDVFAGVLPNLEFVRNSDGLMFRKIGPIWVNGIGNMNPGEGYLVKMISDDQLIYPVASDNVSGYKTEIPDHYKVINGNPYDPVWTIYFEANGLVAGDEIAVYDGEKLVGAGVVNSEEILTNSIPVFGNVFESGNTPIFKLWDMSENKEFILTEYSYLNPYGNAYTSNVFPDEDGNYSMLNFSITGISDEISNKPLLSIYPNPSEGIFNILIEGISGDLQMKVIGLRGNEYRFYEFEGIKSITKKQLDLKGLPAGVYFINFSGKNFTQVKKIVIR